MISSSAISNDDRMAFMYKMVATVRDPKGLIVSSWESGFIASFARSSRPSLFFFTEPRRVSADKMRMKYGSETEIGMPYPPAESSPANYPEADATVCQFLVREDGRQQPCNAPATKMRQNRFRYCEAHAEAVQRDLKRHGKTIILIPFSQANAKPSIPVEAKEIVVREHVTFPKFT